MIIIYQKIVFSSIAKQKVFNQRKMIDILKNVMQHISMTTNSSYLDILAKTKGTWKHKKGIGARKRKLELSASAKRKQAKTLE